ncbi:Hsp70 family protein [Acidisphaera sp. L21]|uniref:Hsp70 family protein n=1 Tax=Acidisphaera sp. L21 TaxID=1641851 RepID=UPI00131A9F55|nr:Hsp70 family protein [Acidisphaera sp. L21]
MTTILGIDFGTTNSVFAVLDTESRQVTTRRFAVGGEDYDVFRTVLCFWADQANGRTTLRHAAGPAAILAYLDEPLDSRLVMSTKTYLASKNFTATNLFGRTLTLEQLIGLFLRDLFGAAELDTTGLHIVAGRPVQFAGEQADDALGQTRLRAAFAEAGFPSIDLALEPEAAGYRFTRALNGAATVLVGDFGGGTSDFSVLRFDPGADTPITALGRAGVGIAGDSFDARIMDKVVAPLLGKNTTYKPWGTDLPVPAEWYSAFARWHRLSMMRSPRTMRDIAEVRRTADHPERLDHLVSLIEDEQGYSLYRAVSNAKAALSSADSTSLRFDHAGFSIDQPIARTEFEGWIAPELKRLDATITEALAASNIAEHAIDRVFLTGGTAFVPAVRALFDTRFGPERVSGGGEFVSVAEGLALIGAERLGL